MAVDGEAEFIVRGVEGWREYVPSDPLSDLRALAERVPGDRSGRPAMSLSWSPEALALSQGVRGQPAHHDSYTMDGVEQQIVEGAHRAYAAHLERRERDLRAAYGIPDEATTAEAIRIIRQHGRRRGGSLHAPERAMDIPGPPDENGDRTVIHFTTSFSVPMLTPEEARAAAERYLAGHSGTWVRPESHFDAIDRLTASVVDDGYRYGSDQAAFDTDPDGCWRCCAVKAENDLGTCDACRDDLRG